MPLAQTSSQPFLLCLPLSSTSWCSDFTHFALCLGLLWIISSALLAPRTIDPLRILKSRSSPVVRLHLSTVSWVCQRLLKLSTPSVELFAPLAQVRFSSTIPPAAQGCNVVGILYFRAQRLFLKGQMISRYLRPCQPSGLYSALPSLPWTIAWLHSNKTLVVDADVWVSDNFRVSQNILVLFSHLKI